LENVTDTELLSLNPWELAVCTFTNDNTAFLKIVKNVTEDSPLGSTPVDFEFEINEEGGTTISLDENSPEGMNMTEIIPVPTGDYNVTELTPPAGWNLDSSNCEVFSTTDGVNTDASLRNVTTDSLSLDPWELAVCTFTNDFPTGKIIIIKDTLPVDDGYDFPFTINSTSLNDAFELDDCEQENPVDCPAGLNDDPTLSNMTMYGDLPLGVYNITEHIPEGVQAMWSLQDIECVTTDANSTIFGETKGPSGGSIFVDLEADDVVTCTFTNHTPFPTRTQGYWKTHTDVTTGIFDNPPNATDAALVGFTNGTIIIGNSTSGKTIDDIRELFGVYYSSIPKQSDGSDRPDPDQIMMIMLHQLVTAQLNCGAFGCSSQAVELINTCNDAFASANLTTIQYTDSSFFNGTGCVEELDNYNNSGETFSDSFPPGASPTASKNLANEGIPFGDVHYGDTGISRWNNPTAMSAFINVTKIVIIDDGGNEIATDFGPFTVNDNVVDLGVASVVMGGTDGNHIVAEQTNENYTQSFSDECPGGIVSSVPEQTVDCIIINDDIAPTLKLNVTIVNGGNATASNFTLFATSGEGRNFSDEGNSTTFHEVFSNADYTLTSDNGFGFYQDNGWTCDGGNLVTNVVTLTEGETMVTCSIELEFTG
jgi:hypothetical protein